MATPKYPIVVDDSSSSFSFELNKKVDEYDNTNKVLKIHDDIMNKANKKLIENGEGGDF